MTVFFLLVLAAVSLTLTSRLRLLPELCNQLQRKRDECHRCRHVHQCPSRGSQKLDPQAEAANGWKRRLQHFPPRRHQDGGRRPRGRAHVWPHLPGSQQWPLHGVRRLLRWIASRCGWGRRTAVLNVVTTGKVKTRIVSSCACLLTLWPTLISHTWLSSAVLNSCCLTGHKTLNFCFVESKRMLMLLLTALYLRFYMACQYIHRRVLNTFRERHVVRGGGRGRGRGEVSSSKCSTSILKTFFSMQVWQCFTVTKYNPR